MNRHTPNQEKNNHQYRHNTLIWLGIAFGIGFYFIDSILDSHVFGQSNLRDQLLNPNRYELFERVSVLLISIGFAAFAQLRLNNEIIAKAKTRRAERFLNSIVENIPGMVLIKDARELRFVRVNSTAEKLMGYSSEEFIGKNDYDFFPKAQADYFTSKDRQVLAMGSVLDIPEEEIDTRHLGRRILHTKKVPILDESGKPAFLLGIAEDITEAKLSAAALQQTEIRFQTLFESAAEFIFVIDPDGVILKTNRYVYEQSGYVPEELEGRNIKDFFSEKSKQICEGDFPALRERGYNRANVELVCKDGRTLQMECQGTGIPDENGNFSSFLIIQRDITEREQAATALAESERRFRAIFNSTFQFIGLLNPDGIVLEANQTSMDFIGQSDDDVIGKPFWETPWWTHSKDAQEQLKTAIREAASGKTVRFETEHVSAEGKTAIIDFSLKPVLNEQGETLMIIPEGRDITEHRMAEEAAVRQQLQMTHVIRLSTMGEMASSLAHELNQPLTALISYCDTATTLLEAQQDVPESLPELLQRVTEQAHRAGDIIRHLRHFISTGKSIRESFNVDQLIPEVLRFLDWEFRNSGVKVRLQLESQDCTITADKVQIEQVLINLLRNSLEAIHQGGVPNGELLLQTRIRPNRSVEVVVSDNGPGIDKAIFDKLFEPFQTNKQGGMGMGLPISRTIIEDHGGTLWADSETREGARFGFELPPADS